MLMSANIEKTAKIAVCRGGGFVQLNYGCYIDLFILRSTCTLPVMAHVTEKEITTVASAKPLDLSGSLAECLLTTVMTAQ